MSNGILSALSDEFYKMSTFADDYYKNIIMPYKEGVTSKPGFQFQEIQSFFKKKYPFKYP